MQYCRKIYNKHSFFFTRGLSVTNNSAIVRIVTTKVRIEDHWITYRTFQLTIQIFKRVASFFFFSLRVK